MKVSQGNLVRLNCPESIPVWIASPGCPLSSDMFVGQLNEEDLMLVLNVLGNGTAQVVSRLGIVWIVSAFITNIIE